MSRLGRRGREFISGHAERRVLLYIPVAMSSRQLERQELKTVSEHGQIFQGFLQRKWG